MKGWDGMEVSFLVKREINKFFIFFFFSRFFLHLSIRPYKIEKYERRSLRKFVYPTKMFCNEILYTRGQYLLTQTLDF